MSVLTYRDAMGKVLREALDNDPKVFLMGEDVGRYGGPYAVTGGFQATYGEERVRDTPISESGFVGCGMCSSMKSVSSAHFAFQQRKLSFAAHPCPCMYVPAVLELSLGSWVCCVFVSRLFFFVFFSLSSAGVVFCVGFVLVFVVPLAGRFGGRVVVRESIHVQRELPGLHRLVDEMIDK